MRRWTNSMVMGDEPRAGWYRDERVERAEAQPRRCSASLLCAVVFTLFPLLLAGRAWGHQATDKQVVISLLDPLRTPGSQTSTERSNRGYLYGSREIAETKSTPVGRVDSGKAFWAQQMCQYCHGEQAEGGWGPDLAGRALSAQQITHALRQPWGLMPAYTETQVSDQNVADLESFFSTLSRATTFGPWRWQSPPLGAPNGQRLQSAFGCGQCHEPELGMPRRWLGGIGKDADFAYFAKQIYRHTDKYPQGRMGNFSEDRLPESVLREIYSFMLDAGLRAPIDASLTAGVPLGTNTTYTLDVFNEGVPNRGLAAENVTIFIRIPKGVKVVGATGVGYKGVHSLAGLGVPPAVAITPGRFDSEGFPQHPSPDLSGDVAVWEVARIEAAAKQTYSLTLSDGSPTEVVKLPGHGPIVYVLKGFEGSGVYWTTPGARVRPPKFSYRDFRIPDKGDGVAITTAMPLSVK